MKKYMHCLLTVVASRLGLRAGGGGGGASIAAVTQQLDEMDIAAQHRSVTGVLASHPDSRDVHIHNLSVLFHGVELLMDSKLELNVGKRYGLIGLNGCGECLFVPSVSRRLMGHIISFGEGEG